MLNNRIRINTGRLLCGLCIVLLMIGCSGDQSTEPRTEEKTSDFDRILGKWRAVEVIGLTCYPEPCLPDSAFWTFDADSMYAALEGDSVIIGGRFDFINDTLNCSTTPAQGLLDLEHIAIIDYQFQGNDSLIMQACGDSTILISIRL